MSRFFTDFAAFTRESPTVISMTSISCAADFGADDVTYGLDVEGE